MVALRNEMVICRVVVIEDITPSMVPVIKPSTGKGDVTATDDSSFIAVFFEDISEGGNAGEESLALRRDKVVQAMNRAAAFVTQLEHIEKSLKSNAALDVTELTEGGVR